MIKFEVAKDYEDKNIKLPERGTAHSAGYDFYVAEDIVIPPYQDLYKMMDKALPPYQNLYKLAGEDCDKDCVYQLEDIEKITKKLHARPTLVPTGVKCKLDPDTYLELSMRSSSPLKYWLIMANSVGIIDADYYGNPDNDGAMYFQVINLSPYNIALKKGDRIGQGIIKHYLITDDDNANGERLGGFGSTN